MVISEMEIRLRADIARLQRDMDAARQTVTSATNGMARAADAAKSALAGIGLGMGMAQVIQMTDQYTKFTAQLRLATLSTREYNQALASVKAISTAAQTSIADMGVLYAKIANGTRELGNTQKQVAEITEVVGLGLKVSGATAQEASSAMLQLSQAFASGVLRGEEFNAVNEAGPRVMQALADGIGVPVGALKKMAEEGKLTSDVLSDALPRSLQKLREEAKEVQTISGAFQVLKDRIMEVTAVRAKDNGSVAAMTQGIELLADNLSGLLTIMTGLTVIKAGTWAAEWVAGAHARIMANKQMTASAVESAAVELRRAEAERQSALIAQSRAREGVAAARAEVAADKQRMASAAAAAEAAIVARQAQFAETARIVRAEIAVEKTRHAAQINDIGRAARVAEMAKLATQLAAIEKGMAASSAELAAVRIANENAAANAAAAGAARIAAAREAEVVATGGAAAATLRLRLATAGLTAAMGAASLAGNVVRGGLALLGGPIGAVITLLTIGGMAWMTWGNKAEVANDKVAKSTEETTKEMIERLDKQIEKLRERNNLAATEPKIKNLGELNDADAAGLARAKAALDENRRLQSVSAPGREKTLLGLDEIDLLHDYELALAKITDREAEVARGKEIAFNKRYAEWLGQNGTAAQKEAYELEKLRQEYGRITPEMERWVKAKYADKSANQEKTAYQNLITSIHEKIAANDLEINGYGKLSESQQMTIKLDAAIGTGKNKLSEGHINEARALIGKVAAQEQAIEAQQRSAKWAEVEAKNDADHYASLRAGTAAIDDRIKQMEREIETYGLTASAAIDMEKAKLEAKLAAGPATYAELIALDEQIAKMEKLAELAGNKEALDANKKAAEQMAEDQKRLWSDIERTAHDTFISIFDSGKSAFDRLKDALKNGLYELLYQMTVKKWIINISGQMSGQGGISQIAGMIGGSGSGNGWLGNISSLMSVGKTIFSGFSSGLATSMGGHVTQFGNLIGSQGVSAFGTGMGLTSSQAGTAAAAYNAAGNTTVAGGLSAGSTAASVLSVAGWIAAGMAAADALYKKGFDPNNGSTNTALTNPLIPGAMHNNKIFQALGMNAQWANMFSGASVVTALFGRKNPEVRERGLEGTMNASGFNGQQYAYVVEKGGVFRSDKWYTKNAALDAAQDSGLDATMQGMILAVKGFGAAMGLETSVINGYSKAIKIQLTDDEAKNQEAIAKMFGEVGDELATRLVPSIASLGKTGETAATTLQRVATNYAGVDAALSLIGKQFGQIGIQSIAARERLVNLFGGVDVLSQSMGSYAQNFLSEAERLAPTAAAVKTAMADLGLASVTTRLQFKQTVDNLVKSGALATEAGAKQFATLMSLQEAFALVTPDVDLTTQRTALTEAYNAESQALQATITRMGSFATSLRNLRNSALLGGLSPLSPAQKYAEAKSQYEAVLAAARGGDEAAQGRYQDAYTAFLEASRVVNASSIGYRQDFDYAQAATEEAAKWAEAQVDVGQAQLTALEKQVSGLIEVKQEVMSVRDAILQLNTVLGKNTAPLTAVVAPPPVAVPYSSYGTANTEALVAEVKALRTEVAGLRADQNGQTGALIAATRGAGEQTADKVSGAVRAAATTEVRVKPE